MKCPNCNSQMFVIDETVSARSHVVFYRCSLCISEHVSSEPVAALRLVHAADPISPPAADTRQPVMA